MNPVSWILSSGNATTILLTSKAIFCSKWGHIKQSNDKLLHELYFTDKFHYQNLHIFALKCYLPDCLTCQTLLLQLGGGGGDIGLKCLKNLALTYPLFVHNIEVWHFAY